MGADPLGLEILLLDAGVLVTLYAMWRIVRASRAAVAAMLPWAAVAVGLYGTGEGPFTMTVFTAADRIVAGPVDVSILVQDRADGAPILDGRVTLELPPAAAVVTATHNAATNKLLYGAWLDVPPGRSDIRVSVERGDDIVSVDVPVSAGPATTRLARYWPHLLVPPIAILLLVLHERLASVRRSAVR